MSLETACPKPRKRRKKKPAGLKRSGWLRRSWKTKGGRGSMPDKIAWLRLQGCDICGHVPSEAHHDRPGGARADDRRTVPLGATCHHREGPESVTVLGRRRFQAHHRYDLAERTAYWEARWQREKGA